VFQGHVFETLLNFEDKSAAGVPILVAGVFIGSVTSGGEVL
jgi:hypothetical protein